MEQENKKKILIIDDDESLNTVLIDKLNISGFETEKALDGEEGLRKALDFRPDIILLDLMMPKMDGIEVLKELRKDDWGKKVKVFVLTALEQADYMAEAIEYNIFGYFVKTNQSLDEIVSRIKEALKV